MLQTVSTGVPSKRRTKRVDRVYTDADIRDWLPGDVIYDDALKVSEGYTRGRIQP